MKSVDRKRLALLYKISTNLRLIFHTPRDNINLVRNHRSAHRIVKETVTAMLPCFMHLKFRITSFLAVHIKCMRCPEHSVGRIMSPNIRGLLIFLPIILVVFLHMQISYYLETWKAVSLWPEHLDEKSLGIIITMKNCCMLRDEMFVMIRSNERKMITNLWYFSRMELLLNRFVCVCKPRNQESPRVVTEHWNCACFSLRLKCYFLMVHRFLMEEVKDRNKELRSCCM